MTDQKKYFFCGIGGSGMLPLAAIVKARGASVSGSDRALDQGRTGEKFDYLRSLGVDLHPQDGSGLVSEDQILVASAAVEDTVPDVAAANRLGITRMTRAELLSTLFNAAPSTIAVGGTSGKSTTTAMIGWILHAAGRRPTIMNGAVMKNFVPESGPFASAVTGDGELFVSEVDESDGSIALFKPTIAVLNNITLDHKSMEELRILFTDFIGKAERAVINLDDEEAAQLADGVGKVLTYSLYDESADIVASADEPLPAGIAFSAGYKDLTARIELAMPGQHNVSNALAALCCAVAAGVDFQTAATALNKFIGVGRRFDVIGEAAGVTVIDDFGHNPDKIAATLATLQAFPGRLLVMFQPHGYGPLRKMHGEFVDCFIDHLSAEDLLILPEPVYYGGTVDRSVTSKDIVDGVSAGGRKAHAFDTRDQCGDWLVENARAGDRIVVMGARDDTLPAFAARVLARISAR